MTQPILCGLARNLTQLCEKIAAKTVEEAVRTCSYSGGVTDPDYCVLRFTATAGRYYSNFKSEDFSIE
jgi:hypothetical protein